MDLWQTGAIWRVATDVWGSPVATGGGVLVGLASANKNPSLPKWNMSRVARWPVFHRPDLYFTANLAEAGILKISAWSRYFQNKCIGVIPKGTHTELLKLQWL